MTVREYHFLNQFNYVVGVRFTARLAEFVPNSNPNTEPILAEVRDGFYTDPGVSFAGEKKTMQEWIIYRNTGGFQNKGGYHIYFDSSWEANSA